MIGKALKTLFQESVIKREELFITTKVAENTRKLNEVRQSIENSLRDLQLDYIDLFLIHCPLTENPVGTRGHDIIEQLCAYYFIYIPLYTLPYYYH